MTRGNVARPSPPQRRGPDKTTIIVMGGDPVVGEALEQLLSALGYDARFLSEIGGEDISASLKPAHLLLLAPGLHTARSRKILASIAVMPESSRPSVLKLINVPEKDEDLTVHYTLWPCQTHRLRTEIEAILSKRQRGSWRSSPGQAGTNDSALRESSESGKTSG